MLKPLFLSIPRTVSYYTPCVKYLKLNLVSYTMNYAFLLSMFYWLEKNKTY